MKELTKDEMILILNKLSNEMEFFINPSDYSYFYNEYKEIFDNKICIGFQRINYFKKYFKENKEKMKYLKKKYNTEIKFGKTNIYVYIHDIKNIITLMRLENA